LYDSFEDAEWLELKYLLGCRVWMTT
jgi:hypothetical protein